MHLRRVPAKGGLVTLFRDGGPRPLGPGGDEVRGSPGPPDPAADRAKAPNRAVPPLRRGLAVVRRDLGRGVGALAATRLLVGGRVRTRGAVVFGYHDVHD